MIVCGQEEPLQVNEYIHLYDEQTGKVILNRVEEPGLNRYSFVALNLADYAKTLATFSTILGFISEELKLELSWCYVWVYAYSADYLSRGKFNYAKRKKEGWNLYQDEVLAVATKRVEKLDVSTYEPPDHTFRDGCLFLLLGMAPAPETLISGPLRATLEEAARRDGFVPGSCFIKWLSANKKSVIYSAKDSLGRPGIIVITPERLPTQQLEARGLVNEVVTGVNAGKVWMCSWK